MWASAAVSGAGEDDESLLDGYHWKDTFLAQFRGDARENIEA